MADVLQRSPSHFPSPSSSSAPNDGPHPHAINISTPSINHCVQFHLDFSEEEEEESDREGEGDQLSLLTFLVAAFRKSLIGCRSTSGGSARAAGKLSSMEIGWPSDVRHVAHVTFDRFNGFLGLPVEFELEVPRRAPSARSLISNPFLDFCNFSD